MRVNRLSNSERVMTWPQLLWMSVFMIAPILFIGITSLQSKGRWGGIQYDWSGSSYIRLLDIVYLKVFWASLKLATMTACSCLLIGYPMAWWMAQMRPARRRLAMLLIMLPFMSNFVVRAYAVKFLIGVEGPINRVLMYGGWIDVPIFLESPRLAIWFGMVTNYLPFMVLPLFVVLERFDMTLVEAARDLGASWWQVCAKVLWPSTKKPVMAGLTLVFIPAMGEFVIPDLMGGGKTMYLGNLMTEQFLRVRDWPFGAAICLTMMVIIGLAAACMSKVFRL